MPKGVGRAGEAAARSHVVNELGYIVLETNFRTREGEVDIVARDNEWVVFIEVKTRTNRAFGTGIEQIAAKKSLRLQSAALRFLAANDLENSEWRIDLLSISVDDVAEVEPSAGREEGAGFTQDFAPEGLLHGRRLHGRLLPGGGAGCHAFAGQNPAALAFDGVAGRLGEGGARGGGLAPPAEVFHELVNGGQVS